MDMIFELPIRNPTSAGRPSANAIYELLRSAILSGEVAPGCRLPPTRLSSKRFGLSRSTMVAIYERLSTEDLIESRRGSGTYVCFRRQGLQPPVGHTSGASPPAWLAPAMERKAGSLPLRRFPQDSSDVIELRPGFLDPKLFPFEQFRRSMAKALRHMERSHTPHGTDGGCQGDSRLRAAISNHVTLMKAIVADPDSIMVTSGARQAIELLARTLVEPGKTIVAIEAAGHQSIAEPFEVAGAIIRLVPVDKDGMVVDLIPEDTNIICVSPSCQHPLGVALSEARRHQLNAIAKRLNCLVIEDDYGGELRTSGDPLQPLHSLNPGNSFYVGTFSVSMLPTFRLGYLIAPAWAMDAIIAAKRNRQWQSSSVIQAAAVSFITDGYLSGHIARMRQLYADRKQALGEAVDGRFGEFLRPLPSPYGLQLSAVGNPAINWNAVAERARHERIHVRSLSQYPGAGHGLVFGVGAESQDRLRQAFDRLAGFI